VILLKTKLEGYGNTSMVIEDMNTDDNVKISINGYQLKKKIYTVVDRKELKRAIKGF